MFIPLGNYGDPLRQGQFISADRIKGGVITAQEIILAGGTKSVIRSQNFDPDPLTGWAIFGDGTAKFGAGVIVGGDIESSNWNGASPANLASEDAAASSGFYLDSSEGAAQFEGSVFVGGELRATDGSLYVGKTTDDFIAKISQGSDGPIIEYKSGDEVTTFASISYGTHPTDGDMLLLDSGTDLLRLKTTDKIDLDAGQIITPNGSVSTPMYSFINDIDTGIYRVGANVLGIAAGGSLSASFLASTTRFSDGSASAPGIAFQGDTDTGLFSHASNVLGITAGGTLSSIHGPNQAAFSDGTVSLPGISFYNDGDTGFYRTASGVIRVAANGAEIGLMYASQSRWPSGSTTSPGITFNTDVDTGISNYAANRLGLVVGGTLPVAVLPSGSGSVLYMDRSITDVGNVATLRLATGATGQVVPIGWFSSWEIDPETGEKRKHRIVKLNSNNKRWWRREWIDDLEPVKYERVKKQSRPTDFVDRPIEIGFTIENLIENTNLLTTNGADVGDSPDEVALIAIAIDAIKDLRKRVAALEAKVDALV